MSLVEHPRLVPAALNGCLERLNKWSLGVSNFRISGPGRLFHSSTSSAPCIRCHYEFVYASTKSLTIY